MRVILRTTPALCEGLARLLAEHAFQDFHYHLHVGEPGADALTNPSVIRLAEATRIAARRMSRRTNARDGGSRGRLAANCYRSRWTVLSSVPALRHAAE
jgi:hypothetical protein